MLDVTSRSTRITPSIPGNFAFACGVEEYIKELQVVPPRYHVPQVMTDSRSAAPREELYRNNGLHSHSKHHRDREGRTIPQAPAGIPGKAFRERARGQS